MADEVLIIDDRSSGDFESAIGTSWRMFTDSVMGGNSNGSLTIDTVEGKSCLRLRGDVSLDNNGGFVQAALDLGLSEPFNASEHLGLLVEVYGNSEVYNLHLRTNDTRLPWQSYRTSFLAKPHWQTVRLPFHDFRGYRINREPDLKQVRRIGLVAIGHEFMADLCIGTVALYR